MDKIKNKFDLNEWSGAVGDLGTLLPIAFALIVMNGFSTIQIFLFFGIVYLITGWFYKVPVSVQPLKAMAVIALAKGYSPEFISSTAFFYGILFIILTSTGIIGWLHKWFSSTIVRGIQLGIGLILAKKAIQLVLEKGLLLNISSVSISTNILLFLVIIGLIIFFQVRKKFPITLVLIVTSIIIVKIMGYEFHELNSKKGIDFVIPNFEMLIDGFIFLMLPQLPLTLGNAVFAANDVCHDLWGKQAQKVTPKKFGFSIGLSNIFIGLFGGFPICHGAGGMGAHAQFGAKTGGSTIILGAILIITAIVTPISVFIFFIPVPILGAMLLFDSYRMGILVKKLNQKIEIITAVVVGVLSLITNNLAIALLIGLIIEHSYKSYNKRNLQGMKND